MRSTTRSTLAWAALLLVSAGGCEHGAFKTTNGDSDDGNEALLAGQVEAAIAAYEAAAADIPENPRLNFDRGLAESAAGNHEEAHQRLVRALDTRDRSLLQKIDAALGVNYARWGLALEQAAAASTAEEDSEGAPTDKALEKWTRAVEHLEAALVHDPSDAQSLRTLEVALLRVDPPCASRNDELEPNNAASQASPIEVSAEEPGAQSGVPAPSAEAARDRLAWRQQLFSCPDDVDWLKIALEDGDRLEVSMTVPDEGGRLALSFLGAEGSRDLSAQVARDAPSDGPMTAFQYTVQPGGQGVYYLRVDNLDLEEVSYSVEVAVRPRCDKTEDRFEDNDGRHQAPILTPGPLPDLKICPDDDDWYSVQLAEGESLFLFASLSDQGGGQEDEPKPAEGEPPPPPPIFTEIYGQGDAAIAEGAPAGQGRISTLLTPGPGTYQFRVHGAPELEARYQLDVRVVPPCPEGDDAFEDNDLAEDAVDLAQAMQGQGAPPDPGGHGQPPTGQPTAAGGAPQQTLFARICSGDEDWFSYLHQGEQPAIITATFEHAKGDLKLELYDETGTERETDSDISSPAANAEALAIAPAGDDEEPRKRTIRVSGNDGAENFFLLRVDQPQPNPDSDNQDQDQQDEDSDDSDDSDDDKDEEEQPPDEQENQPLEDALDKLDRNPENLEAVDSARKSPLANHRPMKDW